MTSHMLHIGFSLLLRQLTFQFLLEENHDFIVEDDTI